MATTTYITNIADNMDLTDYANEFIDDYDMDAVYSDYWSAVQERLPEGVMLFSGGDVVATLEQADLARDIDWDDLLEDIDVAPFFERHEKTSN